MCAQEIQGTFFELTPPKISFKQWQIRNRLYCKGANQLGDTELLAHIVCDQNLAKGLMRHFNSLLTYTVKKALMLSRSMVSF
jgi:DNA repair protein RadC